MKKLSATLLLTLSVAVAACDVFVEPEPEVVRFRMVGAAGDSAMAIYSRDFVAGSNELGQTRVELFGNDTVVHQLPIDTVFNISVSQQFFVQVQSFGNDTLAVSVSVDVDDRNVLDSSGGIFPGIPWRYVYQFNQFFGEITEVIF